MHDLANTAWEAIVHKLTADLAGVALVQGFGTLRGDYRPVGNTTVTVASFGSAFEGVGRPQPSYRIVNYRVWIETDTNTQPESLITNDPTAVIANAVFDSLRDFAPLAVASPLYQQSFIQPVSESPPSRTEGNSVLARVLDFRLSILLGQ